MRNGIWIVSLFVLVLLSSFVKTRNERVNDPILWGTKEITWEDFKGKPDPSRRSAATSLSEVQIELKRPSKNKAVASIQAFFQTDKSFARYKDPTLLQHERGHFDIAELYARKMREALSKTSYLGNTYEEQVMKLYDRLNEELNHYQDKYDEETDFSMALDQQKKWYGDIQLDLKNLERYSDPIVHLKVDWAK